MLLTPHALLDIFETALGTKWKHISVTAVRSPKIAPSDVVFSSVLVVRQSERDVEVEPRSRVEASQKLRYTKHVESVEYAIERHLREYDIEDNEGLKIVLGLFGGYDRTDSIEIQMGFIDPKMPFMGFEKEIVERDC